MNVYPRDVSHFPMFYSDEERKLLAGAEMLEHVEEEIEEVTEEYEAIVSAVPEFKEYSLEEYVKNKTLVISRIFYVKMNGVIERVMVPLADMFNHHYERVGETSWCYNDKEEAFTVSAVKPIAAGDAIYEHYGQKPNYRFLFYYGFLIENNMHNCVYIKLSFNKDDANVRHKASLIGADVNSYIKAFKFFEYYNIDEAHNDKFFSYLRLVEYKGSLGVFGRYLNPEVPNVMMCKFLKRKLRCPVLSVENEKCVLEKVKAVAKERLAKFPDPYESDMELLQNKSLSFNERNCIVFRSDEKRIFRGLIELADLGLKLIEMKTAAQTYYEQLPTLPYAKYFEKLLLPFLNKLKSHS
eukprot:TRINITY_DN17842_c0_g1_i3.p1 TRINITY_DN17842_c0_g1~~TRINITY_DN17842_c0_g1_i3.p1  ORF type:complete len:353 (-),score=107.19 TRINITY_DN17842_c0_g1_i3:105-1163(-)